MVEQGAITRSIGLGRVGLRPKLAPLVLVVFKSSFGRDQRSVAAERLHAQVEADLDELSAGGEDVPNKNGRALCLQCRAISGWSGPSPTGRRSTR